MFSFVPKLQSTRFILTRTIDEVAGRVCPTGAVSNRPAQAAGPGTLGVMQPGRARDDLGRTARVRGDRRRPATAHALGRHRRHRR